MVKEGPLFNYQETSAPRKPANVGVVSSSLRQVIVGMLQNSGEISGPELKSLLVRKTGRDPPPNFLDIVISLPDVLCKR